MSTVRARVWRFTVERGKTGAEAVQAVEIGQGPLPVSLAAVVNINALACDLRKTVDQRVRDHEISLLLSYVIGDQGKKPLGVEHLALDSSAGHIKRFVSECTGLGVMTAASEFLFDWKPGAGGLSSFDVLPGKLRGVYAKTGVRPDLLYDLAAGPVAGEARGRRRDAQQMFPPGEGTPEQRKRLEKLARWSVAHGDHDYFMSWVWLGVGGVYVDVFLPEGSAALRGLNTAWIEEPGDATPWRFHVPRLVSRSDPGPGPDPGPGQSLKITHHVPSTSAEGPPARVAISRVGPAAEEAMDRAFSREEQTLGTFAGVPVRGRWIRGDALGEARHEVLLGVLGERVETNRRRAQRLQLPTLAGDHLDMFLDGRLLTVVRLADGPRPEWGRIREELLAQV